jgi:hypothetical protein
LALEQNVIEEKGKNKKIAILEEGQQRNSMFLKILFVKIFYSTE